MVTRLYVMPAERPGSRSVDGLLSWLLLLLPRLLLLLSVKSSVLVHHRHYHLKPAAVLSEPQDGQPHSQVLSDFIRRKWSFEHPIYELFFGNAPCVATLRCDGEMQRIFETCHRHRSSLGPTQGLLAVAACILARGSREYQRASIRFCNTAISTITDVDLTQSTTPLSEDFLITITLLSLYEVGYEIIQRIELLEHPELTWIQQQYDLPLATPRRMHFKGLIQALPCFRRNDTAPPGRISHVVLESLLYHVTVASTFSFDELGDLPYDYIDRIIQHMHVTSVLPVALGTSFAVYGIPVALLTVAYKASVLRQRTELDQGGMMGAFELSNQLRTIVESSFAISGPFVHLPLVAQLWANACKILLALVMDPRLEQTNPTVLSCVQSALHIAHGGNAQLENVGILWPLTIISFATRSAQEYQIIRAPLVRLRQVTNTTFIQPVVDYLDRTLHQATHAPYHTSLESLLPRRLSGLRM